MTQTPNSSGEHPITAYCSVCGFQLIEQLLDSGGSDSIANAMNPGMNELMNVLGLNRLAGKTAHLKGPHHQQEFLPKIAEERSTYQAMLKPVAH